MLINFCGCDQPLFRSDVNLGHNYHQVSNGITEQEARNFYARSGETSPRNLHEFELTEIRDVHSPVREEMHKCFVFQNTTEARDVVQDFYNAKQELTGTVYDIYRVQSLITVCVREVDGGLSGYNNKTETQQFIRRETERY